MPEKLYTVFREFPVFRRGSIFFCSFNLPFFHTFPLCKTKGFLIVHKRFIIMLVTTLHGVYLMDVLMNSAKVYYSQGLFDRFEIHPSGSGWVIRLYFRDTSLSFARLVDARNKQERIFVSIDAALKTVRQLGFSFDGLRAC